MSEQPRVLETARPPAATIPILFSFLLAGGVAWKLGVFAPEALGALVGEMGSRWKQVLALLFCPVVFGHLLNMLRNPGPIVIRLAVFAVGAPVVAALFVTFGCWHHLQMEGGGLPVIKAADESSHDKRIATHRRGEHKPLIEINELPDGPDSPVFRGPGRDGIYEGPLRQTWPEGGPAVVWRIPVGGGYGGMVTQGRRLVTIEQRGAEEVLACYDLLTGAENWTSKWPAHFKEQMGGDGPRATPTIAGKRVYGLGATGWLVCCDLETGEALWRRNILTVADAKNVQWGMSGSPLVLGDQVIVNAGGPSKALTAYDARSGKTLWQGGNAGAGYSSPDRYTLLKTPQLLNFGAKAIEGVSLEGEVLWSFPWKTSYDINVAQPIQLGDNQLLVSSGYGTGAGLLTLSREGGKWSVKAEWSRNRSWEAKFSSGCRVGDVVYGLDNSKLVCVEAATGKQRWKGANVGFGQQLVAGGLLLVSCENGDLLCAKATPESYQQLGRIPVFNRKPTWNTPTLARGLLLLRGDREMICFDMRQQESE